MSQRKRDDILEAAIRRVILDQNPQTQVALMMISADLAVKRKMSPALAVDKAHEFWEANCKQRGAVTWAQREKLAADFIAGLRRSDAGWREILERGTQ